MFFVCYDTLPTRVLVRQCLHPFQDIDAGTLTIRLDLNAPDPRTFISFALSKLAVEPMLWDWNAFEAAILSRGLSVDFQLLKSC